MKKKIIGILIVVVILGIGLFSAVPALADVNTNTMNSVVISPASVSIGAGGKQIFTAQAKDSGGAVVTNASFFWMVVANGGTIESTGNNTTEFTAGGTPGTYSNTVQVVAVQNTLTIIANATVIVTDTTGILDHVVVTPDSATVAPNGTRQFAAQAYDVNNVAITGLTYVWSVTDGVGTITNTGLFTADTNTGTFNGAIQVSVTQTGTTTITKTDTANVIIGNRNTTRTRLNIRAMTRLFDGYLNSVGFENFLGGQWQVKNGANTDTIKVIPGVVQSATATSVVIIPNGQITPVTYTLTSSSVLQPKNTTLDTGDKVVVITVNDQVKLVVKVVNQTNTEQMPPGLRKHGDDKRDGKNTPPGWSKGNKTGWQTDEDGEDN